MNLRISRAAVVFLAALAVQPVHAGDKTYLIELERQSDALPNAVNADGSVVVGVLSTGAGAFYWMPTTGTVFLGGQSATGVSADGTRIVGVAPDANGIENAAIWLRGTEWRLLGSFANAVPCDLSLSSATDISRDGSVIVGIAFSGCGAHAFRWQESTGMVDLGSLVPGRSTQALGVSGDGRVVVGRQDTATGYRQGARWIDGRQELFSGPEGGMVGGARAVNRDGTIVGGAQCRPDDSNDQSAWIWTPSGGTECLAAPARRFSPLVVITEANATSDDGRVIGGKQGAASSPDQDAVVWINRAPAYLKDLLRANGVPGAFETWINTGEITGVSPDGRILVGAGAALGGYRGYMVILGSDLVMP